MSEVSVQNPREDLRVIPYRRLPARFSIAMPAFWWLFLDYVSAPGWVFGAVLSFVGCLFVVSLVQMCRQEQVDPLARKP